MVAGWNGSSVVGVDTEITSRGEATEASTTPAATAARHSNHLTLDPIRHVGSGGRRRYGRTPLPVLAVLCRRAAKAGPDLTGFVRGSRNLGDMARSTIPIVTIATEQSTPNRETFVRRRPLVVSLLLTGCAALAFSMSWFLAAAPLTGVEPSAAYIDCGPALVDRPDPLPHPSCAGAYGEVIFLSALLGLTGALSLGVAVVVAAHAKGSRVSPLSPKQGAATK